MDVILELSLILILGYFSGLFAERLKFPKVSFYLLAGIILSKEVLGPIWNLNFQVWSDIFSNLALCFIAYIVGSEINLNQLKKYEKIVLWGVLFEALFAVMLVFLAFLGFGYFFTIPEQLGLGLAAIAATTAPAASIAVIEENHAKGEMTSSLLGIVALDDAIGILVFGIISALFFGSNDGLGSLVFIKDIGYSALIGGLGGVLLKKVSQFAKSDDFLLPLLIGTLLLAFILSEYLHFSSLFSCMILGCVANNIRSEKPELSLFIPIQHIEDFIFVVFFGLAGTHFSLERFKEGSLYIFLYMLARVLGKYIGAFLGTKIGGASKKTSRWIGLCLFPQAGVAVGLVLQSDSLFHDKATQSLVVNIILGSTVIYAFLGPLMTKLAFKKTGEISS